MQGLHAGLRRLLSGMCLGLAVIGGVILLAVAAAVTLSVALSLIGIGAMPGEFEAIGLACAASASLFLPLAQWRRGHVMVDVFTARLPARGQHGLDRLWAGVLALCWAGLSFRLGHGLVDYLGYGDRSMVLRVPLWWLYLPAILGTALSAVVAGLQAWPGHHQDPEPFA